MKRIFVQYLHIIVVDDDKVFFSILLKHKVQNCQLSIETMSKNFERIRRYVIRKKKIQAQLNELDNAD